MHVIQGVAGSIPKSVEVEFVSDLVGIASPGDLISVTGIVQVSLYSNLIYDLFNFMKNLKLHCRLEVNKKTIIGKGLV